MTFTEKKRAAILLEGSLFWKKGGDFAREGWFFSEMETILLESGEHEIKKQR